MRSAVGQHQASGTLRYCPDPQDHRDPFLPEYTLGSHLTPVYPGTPIPACTGSCVGTLTLALRRTWPRQGELPAGAVGPFLRPAALLTGTGPSASLVSQLDSGEFSSVRCLVTGD